MKYLSVLILAFMATAPAHAANLCRPKPGVKWLSLAQARLLLNKAGYRGFRIGVERGCFEGEGSRNGVKLEIYLHPVTGKIVMVQDDAD